MNKGVYSNFFIILISLSITLVYFMIFYKCLFALPAPSDPLEYITPALHVDEIFPYLDRIVLWIWLRFLIFLQVPSVLVGGVSILLISSLTLGLIVWWLIKNVSLFSAACFTILYVLTPMILEIASYPYPMQLMVFFLLLTLIVIYNTNSINKALFYSGIGFGLAVLSKIQALPFILFLACYIIFLSYKETYTVIIRRFFILILGILSSIIVIFSLLIILDGYHNTLEMILQYFNINLEGQYAGRRDNSFPKVHLFLLEPSSILAVLGVIIVFVKKEFFFLRKFVFAGFFQLFGLLIIYILTQRGGGIIPNYYIDFQIIGLLVFSAILGIMLKDIKLINSLSFFVALILFSFFVIIVFSQTINKVDIYSPIHIVNNKFSVVVAISLWFLIITIGYLLLKKNKFYKNQQLIFISLIIILVCVVIRSQEGVSGALYRKNQWIPNYNILNYVSSLNENKTIWLYTILNAKNVDISSNENNKFYKVFFQNKAIYYDNELLFGKNKLIKNGILITDVPNLYYQYSNLNYGSLPNSYMLLLNKKKSYFFLDKDESVSLIKTKELRSLYDLIEFNYVYLPKENSFLKEIDSSDINNLEIKLINLKDSFFIKQTKDGGLKISPKKHSSIDFRLHFLNSTDVHEDKLYVLSTDRVKLEDNTILLLFLKYSNNGKEVNKLLRIKKDSETNIMIQRIPKNATNISYGWVVDSASFDKSIHLPRILITSYNLINGNIPLWITNYD